MTEAKEYSQPWDDPIVREVRRAREVLFAECDFDLEKFAQRLRQEQSDSGRRIVTRTPRRPNHRSGEIA